MAMRRSGLRQQQGVARARRAGDGNTGPCRREGRRGDARQTFGGRSGGDFVVHKKTSAAEQRSRAAELGRYYTKACTPLSTRRSGYALRHTFRYFALIPAAG